jgi:DNA-directed RNA polymerase sigma subunit (sigma70/sigma32)
VLEIQQYAREPISLDQTIGDEGDNQLGDFITAGSDLVAASTSRGSPQLAGPLRSSAHWLWGRRVRD